MSVITYHQLKTLTTFEERLDVLMLYGSVSEETFGAERYINQRFYSSYQWRQVRDKVITRDLGCDLACDDHPIAGKIIVHHLVPLTVESIDNAAKTILDPEYLISCSLETHNLIHYGTKYSKPIPFGERKPNDTSPWRT